MINSIKENLERVREQIAQAGAKLGRAVEEIELVAISKMHDAEKVREAYEAGQILFGEKSRLGTAREGSGAAIQSAHFDLNF